MNVAAPPLLFLLPLLGLSQAGAPQPSPFPLTEASAPLPSVVLPPELDRVLRDYEKAWQGRDALALAQLFAEDGFVMASTKPPVRGRAAIRAAYAKAGGQLSLRALAFSTAGDTGYIIGAFGRQPGSPDTGKFVLALKRGAGSRWLIMADMDNSNRPWTPTPAPTASPSPSR
jgi:ketosteroid isomerase-like protein